MSELANNERPGARTHRDRGSLACTNSRGDSAYYAYMYMSVMIDRIRPPRIKFLSLENVKKIVNLLSAAF